MDNIYAEYLTRTSYLKLVANFVNRIIDLNHYNQDNVKLCQSSTCMINLSINW